MAGEKPIISRSDKKAFEKELENKLKNNKLPDIASFNADFEKWINSVIGSKKLSSDQQKTLDDELDAFRNDINLKYNSLLQKLMLESERIKFDEAKFTGLSRMLGDLDQDTKLESTPELEQYRRRIGLTRALFGTYKRAKFDKEIKKTDTWLDMTKVEHKTLLSVAGHHIAQTCQTAIALIGEDRVIKNLNTFAKLPEGSPIQVDKASKDKDGTNNLAKIQSLLLKFPDHVFEIMMTGKVSLEGVNNRSNTVGANSNNSLNLASNGIDITSQSDIENILKSRGYDDNLSKSGAQKILGLIAGLSKKENGSTGVALGGYMGFEFPKDFNGWKLKPGVGLVNGVPSVMLGFQGPVTAIKQGDPDKKRVTINATVGVALIFPPSWQAYFGFDVDVNMAKKNHIGQGPEAHMVGGVTVSVVNGILNPISLIPSGYVYLDHIGAVENDAELLHNEMMVGYITDAAKSYTSTTGDSTAKLNAIKTSLKGQFDKEKTSSDKKDSKNTISFSDTQLHDASIYLQTIFDALGTDTLSKLTSDQVRELVYNHADLWRNDGINKLKKINFDGIGIALATFTWSVLKNTTGFKQKIAHLVGMISGGLKSKMYHDNDIANQRQLSGLEKNGTILVSDTQKKGLKENFGKLNTILGDAGVLFKFEDSDKEGYLAKSNLLGLKNLTDKKIDIYIDTKKVLGQKNKETGVVAIDYSTPVSLIQYNQGLYTKYQLIIGSSTPLSPDQLSQCWNNKDDISNLKFTKTNNNPDETIDGKSAIEKDMSADYLSGPLNVLKDKISITKKDDGSLDIVGKGSIKVDKSTDNTADTKIIPKKGATLIISQKLDEEKSESFDISYTIGGTDDFTIIYEPADQVDLDAHVDQEELLKSTSMTFFEGKTIFQKPSQREQWIRKIAVKTNSNGKLVYNEEYYRFVHYYNSMIKNGSLNEASIAQAVKRINSKKAYTKFEITETDPFKQYEQVIAFRQNIIGSIYLLKHTKFDPDSLDIIKDKSFNSLLNRRIYHHINLRNGGIEGYKKRIVSQLGISQKDVDKFMNLLGSDSKGKQPEVFWELDRPNRGPKVDTGFIVNHASNGSSIAFADQLYSTRLTILNVGEYRDSIAGFLKKSLQGNYLLKRQFESQLEGSGITDQQLIDGLINTGKQESNYTIWSVGDYQFAAQFDFGVCTDCANEMMVIQNLKITKKSETKKSNSVSASFNETEKEKKSDIQTEVGDVGVYVYNNQLMVGADQKRVGVGYYASQQIADSSLDTNKEGGELQTNNEQGKGKVDGGVSSDDEPGFTQPNTSDTLPGEGGGWGNSGDGVATTTSLLLGRTTSRSNGKKSSVPDILGPRQRKNVVENDNNN